VRTESVNITTTHNNNHFTRLWKCGDGM